MPIVSNSKNSNQGYRPEDIFASINLLESNTNNIGTKNDTGYYKDSNLAHAAFAEYFNLSDRNTRQTLLSLDEAGHNTVLTTLTSKLYDHIVKKTADIDFGEIPDTNGDVTKLSNYDDLVDCMEIMKGILKEYREPTGPIDTLTTALSNVSTRKDLFMRGFRSNSEMPMLMYNTVVLSIVNGISYMIAACIEFIKAPKDESFQISLDKVAYAKTKDHLLYQSLDKFNKSCEKGDFDKAMEAVIDQRVRKFTGAAIGVLAGTVAGVIIILNIIPILRELVYVIYYSRMKVADFFEIQADLLTMNAYNLEHNNTIDAEKKREIVEKQTAIADKFRKLSNMANIDSKKTDVEASREIQNTKKKYNIDELEDEAESSIDDGSSSSALF